MDYIVILERTSANPLTVRYLLRATVPTARQPYFADVAKTSAYTGISAGDLADLRAGKVIERTSTFTASGQTPAQIKAALVTAQAEFQARVNEDGEHNPFKYFGTAWNGTTWTTAGVS